MEKSEAEKAEVFQRYRKELDLGPDDPIDDPALEYELVKRDPKYTEIQKTKCQQDYFKENPTPPLTKEANFGNGNLGIIYLPPKKGTSRRVQLYTLSDRRGEAEILFPIGTKFRVVENKSFVGDPNDSKTFVTLEELSEGEGI